MGRSTNAELSETTRAALLTQARAAFAEHGYADAPIDAVVRAAGLTKGALYHHFGSKQALFMAVVRELDAEIEARIRSALPARPTTRAQFVDACELFLVATLEPGVRRILLLDCPAVLGHRASREFDAESSIRPLMEGLRALEDAGTIVAIDHEAAAHLINGALYDGALWIGEQALPQQALQRVVATLAVLVEGLAPRAGRRAR
jgi:AcrR family transcriptional regulator